MIRILSFNCWNGRFSKELIAYIRHVNADILCLQEVLWGRADAPRSVYIRETHNPKLRDHPYDPRLYTKINRAFPEHSATFFPSQTAPMYTKDGTSIRDIMWGSALLVRNNLSLIGMNTNWVYGCYQHNVTITPPTSQQAQVMRLHRHDTGTKLVVANMHGVWTGLTKGDCHEREVQALRLERLVRHARHSENDPTVVCGDFNVRPGSVLFTHLAQLGLRDLVTTNGFTGTRTSHCASGEPYADYMFVSPEVSPVSFQVVETPEVSDHKPLILDIE